MMMKMVMITMSGDDNNGFLLKLRAHELVSIYNHIPMCGFH